jgi:YYY domain-containing protein
MAVVTYAVFLFGTIHLFPFTFTTIISLISILFLFGLVISYAVSGISRKPIRKGQRWKYMVLFGVEECFFFFAYFFWSWVKAHEPSIQGLEKFMDYGFMQILLNSQYFPAPDMWWAGGSINYYFFGHLVTAVMTKLSGLDLSVTFNLMLSTLFALTLTMSFSIGVQLSVVSSQLSDHLNAHSRKLKALLSGLMTSFLVTMAGNMQTLYAFTKGYTGDNVVPFWTVLWSSSEFFQKLPVGMATYWYANATRFIPFTIHEFPSYSFVVSDVHGHVLSIPFVLLTIAILIIVGEKILFQDRSMKFLLALFHKKMQAGDLRTAKTKQHSVISYFMLHISYFVFTGFLLGILLMTNALGGPIYGLLFVLLITASLSVPFIGMIRRLFGKTSPVADGPYELLKKIMIPVDIVGVAAFLTAMPFLKYFTSFASGIGVNCPPSFLANTKIGPFLFEGVEKCQKSPVWMMTLLWGFFWYTGIWLFFRKIWTKEQYNNPINRILKVFYICGMILIIIPEFFYVKDIYPAHFRSNTMFKLGYEAFIMWSIIAGYVIVHFLFLRCGSLFDRIRYSSNAVRSTRPTYNRRTIRLVQLIFFLLLLPQLFLISIFPYFSIRSYFGELKTYRGLYGLQWLEEKYPDDFEAIRWLKNEVVSRQSLALRQSGSGELKTENSLPVIVEADGDSYTDYNHVSAFAGVPTIIGWAVHEWLWRGNYDVVSPRKDDVRKIYESTDINEVRDLLKKYNVTYIIVGPLEREKYPHLQENGITALGVPAFQFGKTIVYDMR